MALTKSLITGRVPLPTDEAAKAAEVSFTLSAWDTQGADVIPPAVTRAVLAEDASLPAGFDLWRNTEGQRGSHYIVTVSWSESSRTGVLRREARLGNVQIGDLASYTLAELLERGIDPAPPSFWIAASAGDVQTIVEAANALDGYTEPGYLAEVQAGAASAATSETAAAGSAAQAQAAVDTATGLIITTFGNFDTLAQLVAAHPTAALGNTAFVRETGEAGTVHRWSGSAWVDTGESPLGPLLAKAAPTAPNIWPDPFNEESLVRPFDRGARGANIFGTLASDGALSPYKRPYVLFASGGNAQVNRYLDDLPIVPGDRINVVAHCNFSAGSGQVTVYFYNAAGGVISSQVVTLTSIQTGEQVVSLPGLLVPADTARVQVRAAQGGGGKIWTIAMSKGEAMPVLGSRLQSSTRWKRQVTQKNLWPDPFFRQLAAGVGHQDGWTYAQMAGLNYPTLGKSVLSPFPDGNVLIWPTGSGQADSFIATGHLGLKAGDKLSVVLGVYSAQTLPLAVFGRTADGTLVGSPVNTLYPFTAPMYRELTHTIDVDEAFAKTVKYLVVRFGNGLTVGATPVLVCGRGIFVNDLQPVLFDDGYAEDMQSIFEFRSLPFNTQTLRETQMRLGMIEMGLDAVYSEAILSDSYTHAPDRYIRDYHDIMQDGIFGGQSAYGDAGAGWIGFGNPSGGTGQINGSSDRSITVTVVGTPLPSSKYRSANSPDICAVILDNPAVQYRVNNLPAGTTKLTLHAELSASVISYTTTGDAGWTDIDLSVGAAIHTTDLVVPPGSFNLWLRYKSGAPAEVCGADHRKGARGVVVHKMAATGGLAQEFAARSLTPAWRAHLATVAPNCVNIFLGPNDQGATGRYAERFAEDVSTIVDSVMAAAPTADILLLLAPENQLGRAVRMEGYFTALKKLAATRNLALHWFQQDYGRQPDDYASTSARPLFNLDLLHPDGPTGGGRPMAFRLRKIKING